MSFMMMISLGIKIIVYNIVDVMMFYEFRDSKMT